jgi:hypothetical protein
MDNIDSALVMKHDITTGQNPVASLLIVQLSKGRDKAKNVQLLAKQGRRQSQQRS